MIEIRTAPDAKPARTDGGHHPDQTRAIAAGISEALRLLTYATMPEKGGLRYPSDVYSVLTSLSAAVHMLPQALDQMAEHIGSEVSAGHARENPHYGHHGGDAHAASAELETVLGLAKSHTRALASALASAQSVIRGIESTRHDDE